MTLTVAQAFKVAFEFWQVAKEGIQFCASPSSFFSTKCCVVGGMTEKWIWLMGSNGCNDGVDAEG